MFASCENISDKNIIGEWIFLSGNVDPEILEVHFKKNQVELEDVNNFKDIGKYEVKNGLLKISRNHDGFEINSRIKFLNTDTILIFDSLKYYRNPEITTSEIEEYELIDVETNLTLPKDNGLFLLIHYYKSKKGKIKIRIGDNIISYKDIVRYILGGHSKPTVLLFLGKGISLSDLKSMYCQLMPIIENQRIWIVTKKVGFSDYQYFADEVEAWETEVERHFKDMKSKPPPPRPPLPYINTSKKDYLENGGENITINSESDLKRIENLNKNEKYVFSIDKDLDFKYYIELKQKLRNLNEKFNFEYKTEIEQ